jgi:hypothetical protein
MLSFVEMFKHVTVYISATEYFLALETYPDFTLDSAYFAGVFYMCSLELLNVFNVIACTVWTISLRSDCYEAFHETCYLILHFNQDYNLD